MLRNDEEGSVLYGQLGCEQCEMGEFLVNKAGRLLHHGKLTAWDTSNLSDTGRTSVNIPGPLKVSFRQSELNG